MSKKFSIDLTEKELKELLEVFRSSGRNTKASDKLWERIFKLWETTP